MLTIDIEILDKNSEILKLRNDEPDYYHDLISIGNYILFGKDKGFLNRDFQDKSLNAFCTLGLLEELVEYKNKTELIEKNLKLNRFYDVYKNVKSNPKGKFEFKIKDINIEENLSEYINEYISLFSYLDYPEVKKYLLEIKMYPTVRQLYPYALNKLDTKKYISYLIETGGIIHDIIFFLYLTIEKSITSISTLNKLLSHGKKEYCLDLINRTDLNKINKDDLLRWVSVSSEYKKNRKIDDGKLAICLSGQLRGGLASVKKWIAFAEENNADIFISTWENAGIPSGAHGSKLSRLLPKLIRPYLINMSDKEFYSRYPEFSGMIKDFKVEPALNKIASTSHCIKEIIINNEEAFNRVEFSRDKRQLKMFFNMHTVLKSCLEYEANNNVFYSQFIWSRLDFDFFDFNFDPIYDNRVRTTFTGLGNACGDFFIQMSRNSVHCIRDIYTTILDEEIKLKNKTYLAALKLGLVFNESGFFIERCNNRFKGQGLSSIKFDDYDFFKKCLSSNISLDYPSINLVCKLAIELNKSIKEINVDIISEFIQDLQGNDGPLVDLIRDTALKAERNNDIRIAYSLMKHAHNLRPKGPLIKKKLEEYEKILLIK